MLLIMLALSFTSIMQAQEDGIIFADFEPDPCVYALEDNYISDTISIDFDADGTDDFKMFIAFQSSVQAKAIYAVSSWQIRSKLENDTIIPSEENWFPVGFWYELMFRPYNAMFMEETLGFRKEVEGHYYYAWAKVYYRRETSTVGYPKVWAYFDKFAYCTIPDYPMRWGQTDIHGVEENGAETFATIFPNPSDGTVSVKVSDGESNTISDISVFDMTGRIVKTQTISFEAVDISGLASGVYVMKVTLENGKVFEEKIVKK